MAGNEQSHFKLGILLVAGAAIVWSFGGAIARFLDVTDSWTIVFWRSLSAAVYLLAFMLVREGVRGTLGMIRAMGLPGLGVALCFAIASSSFVVALAHTSVANILLIQAGAPLIAALLTWVFFREFISASTWAAIAAVIAGVAIMVSGSFSGDVSPVGDGLALIIVFGFASAIVITRRHAEISMLPAVFLGVSIASLFSAMMAGGFAVSLRDGALLFAFGALNLGLGLSLFVLGARLVPAAVAALVSTTEPVLAPIWVWLIHGEVPGFRTLIGGAVVVAALVGHILVDWQRQRAEPEGML
jgi:drug/metabolite transporter (DMT)-like permease